MNTTCYYVNVYCTNINVHLWLCVNLAMFVSKVLYKHAAIHCTHYSPKYSYISIHNRSRTHVQVHRYVESIGWARRARRRDPEEEISFDLSVGFKCVASFYMLNILLNRNRESSLYLSNRKISFLRRYKGNICHDSRDTSFSLNYKILEFRISLCTYCVNISKG